MYIFGSCRVIAGIISDGGLMPAERGFSSFEDLPAVYILRPCKEPEAVVISISFPFSTINTSPEISRGLIPQGPWLRH